MGLHVDNVIPPAASYNAWFIGVNDVGIVADIIPHFEDKVSIHCKSYYVNATLNGHGILLDSTTATA